MSSSMKTKRREYFREKLRNITLKNDDEQFFSIYRPIHDFIQLMVDNNTSWLI